MKLRQPAQAGTFYSNKPNKLREHIESCFLHKLGPGKLPNVSEQRDENLVGIIVPHGGGLVCCHSIRKEMSSRE